MLSLSVWYSPASSRKAVSSPGRDPCRLAENMRLSVSAGTRFSSKKSCMQMSCVRSRRSQRSGQ